MQQSNTFGPCLLFKLYYFPESCGYTFPTETQKNPQALRNTDLPSLALSELNKKLNPRFQLKCIQLEKN